MKKYIIALTLLILPLTTFAGGQIHIYPTTRIANGHNITWQQEYAKITYGNNLTQIVQANSTYDLNQASDPTTYNIEAVPLSWYTASTSPECQGTISSGQTITCNIFWTDDGPETVTSLETSITIQPTTQSSNSNPEPTQITNQTTISTQEQSIITQNELILELKRQIIVLLQQLIKQLTEQLKLKQQ